MPNALKCSISGFIALVIVSTLLNVCCSAAETSTSESRKASSARSGPPMLTWAPEGKPKAVVLCVHGLGLHNGTYETFGKRLAGVGVATYALDVRGFGSWQNKNGQGDVDFNDCLEDVRRTLKVLHRIHPDTPVFILGESMGGAIALRATAMYPDLLQGLISCVPSGDRFHQKRTDLKVALQYLKGANKKFDVGTQVIAQATGTKDDPKDVNCALQESWKNDPLAKLSLSPNELIQFQRFMNENHDSTKLIKDKPVLMFQGEDDNLVKAQGTLELWNELPTKDKQIEFIAGAKHLIFEESQFNDQALNDKVLLMVDRWIGDHIQPPPGGLHKASR